MHFSLVSPENILGVHSDLHLLKIVQKVLDDLGPHYTMVTLYSPVHLWDHGKRDFIL